VEEEEEEEAISIQAPMKTEGKKERVFVVLGDEVWESEGTKASIAAKKDGDGSRESRPLEDAGARGTGARGDGTGRRTTRDDC